MDKMLKGDSAAKLTAVRVNLFDKISKQQLILGRAKNSTGIDPLGMSGQCA
jgi:hypothetical protein